MKRPEKSLPDTNAIVRYLVGDNPAQFAKAKDFFDGVKNGAVKAVILESVIAESVYVLTKIYQVPRGKTAGSLIDILRYKGVANDDRVELIRALSLFSEKGLDIVDCILLSKAAAGGNRLFSFDVALNKLAQQE